MVPIVFEDDHLVVIDKPSGLLTHPTAHVRDGTALDHVRDHVGPRVEPKPVHRLDRGTSGLLLFAKQDRALVVLMRHFAERRVTKTYVAIVHGALAEDVIEVTTSIGRVGNRWTSTPDGRAAHTTVRGLTSSGGRTRVALTPHTGRTHQLRIHCASLGHPIVGDPEHGDTSERLHLHADQLAFQHPARGGLITCTSPAPTPWSWP